KAPDASKPKTAEAEPKATLRTVALPSTSAALALLAATLPTDENSPVAIHAAKPMSTTMAASL
ncbi:hypothetical protein EN801_048105, partial [Mesorhizobium sp. M00.F.Ca.ET.158.01.1.1]